MGSTFSAEPPSGQRENGNQVTLSSLFKRKNTYQPFWRSQAFYLVANGEGSPSVGLPKHIYWDIPPANTNDRVSKAVPLLMREGSITRYQCRNLQGT